MRTRGTMPLPQERGAQSAVVSTQVTRLVTLQEDLEQNARGSRAAGASDGGWGRRWRLEAEPYGGCSSTR